ncbi:hypothetical protein COT99_00280 [Candidatus Falkowbacteria bacterium CG10_big_fil_rev_8_21_14_0_10_43_10]|uniref:AAA+ ATPase domain-containing protein n=1 Tax=Candidatus Falkowbacteria bacterium CG10_big_fil_rev_8_21_14_0_10_43_10 TaxID=1974567 RepID=A0A2H0V374_9BACT|nr:MAG: hypothetical protein COT99_00280 [Candidatus Falkowbacteria bacterium CG10_big_fil_rev_8_21_14_0_10_43_10]
MQKFTRIIQKNIENKLFKGKIIIIYGARQVGKTTLVKQIIENRKEKSRYLNCELLSVQQGLEVREADRLKNFLGDYELIILDEAQKITEVGAILKIIHDTYPKLQIIATGSSSFDLANKTSEPLTGRAFRFTLYPFSPEEIKENSDLFSVEAKLENFLRFGSYPEVFFSSEEDAKERLNEISSNYLYKDILAIEGIKKSSIIVDLLRLLALQLGNEVSYNELAVNLGVSRQTVQKYINLLEQSFVVFTLRAFSRNLRKEIAKSVKIYFYDLGIRNSLIQNYNPMSLRNDTGALWENFMISERLKRSAYHNIYANYYFWRTYDQKEIDLIEEKDGALRAYEFKWNKEKYLPPKEFLSNYPNSSFQAVNKNNYYSFVSF